MKNKVKGFTLVELLAVIVILATILVIAVPKITDTIKNDNVEKKPLALSSILYNFIKILKKIINLNKKIYS